MFLMPYWLVSYGSHKKTVGKKISKFSQFQAILWLRGPDYDADSEIRALEAVTALPKNDDDDLTQNEASPTKKLRVLEMFSKFLVKKNFQSKVHFFSIIVRLLTK